MQTFAAATHLRIARSGAPACTCRLLCRGPLGEEQNREPITQQPLERVMKNCRIYYYNHSSRGAGNGVRQSSGQRASFARRANRSVSRSSGPYRGGGSACFLLSAWRGPFAFGIVLQPELHRDLACNQSVICLSKWYYVLFAALMAAGFAIPLIALCRDIFARWVHRD
jgi:hypothetical protein